MAEVFAAAGAAATIIQLVDFGIKVLVRLDKFLSKASRVPEVFQHIKLELKVLLDALQHTQNALETGTIPEANTKSLHEAVDNCRIQITTLDSILSKVLPAPGDSWGKRGLKAIKSLRQERKVEGIRVNLGRCIPVLTYYHAALSSTSGPPAVQQGIALLQETMISSILPLTEQTRHAFLSTDLTLQRQLARIYQQLGHHHTLLRELRLLLDERATTCPNCGTQLCKQCRDTTDASVSTDIFFECASRFSRRGDSTSINSLCSSLAGSPTYMFERNESFDPWRCVVEESLSNLSVVAMKQPDRYTHEYYLLYAKSPRRWRRVIVSATFKSIRKFPIPQVSYPDYGWIVKKRLPNEVAVVLARLLPCVRLFGSVTKVSLVLIEDEAGRIVEEAQNIKSSEDYLEAAMSDQAQILHDVEIMGCKRFTESQVQVIQHIGSSYYFVNVDGQRYVECKYPFAQAGASNENRVRTFFNDLKLRNSLSDCNGVSKFLGVVFDDALQLRSWIFEAPMVFKLPTAFYVAKSNSFTIPWAVRALWSAQISQAVADIHSKGFIVGVLSRRNVGLRADGSAVLTHITTSMTSFLEKEQEPPESLSKDAQTSPQLFNYQTDVFQLGVILWLLAEHRSSTTAIRCSRYVCTHFPRYQCRADHNNLTELPPCLSDVPVYFSDIVNQCRSINPKARPSAREITDVISSQVGITACPRDVLERLKKYLPDDVMVSNSFHCTNCGEWAPDLHYHCYVCHSGNFDLCQSCVAQGIHCYVPDHILVKMTLKRGNMVHVL